MINVKMTTMAIRYTLQKPNLNFLDSSTRNEMKEVIGNHNKNNKHHNLKTKNAKKEDGLRNETDII